MCRIPGNIYRRLLYNYINHINTNMNTSHVVLNIQPNSDDSDYSDSDDSNDSNDSSSSGEMLSSNRGIFYKDIKVSGQRFDDYTLASEYEKVRNKYFTPDIIKHSVSVRLSISGTTTLQKTSKLVDTTQKFFSSVVVGDLVTDSTGNTATITAIDNDNKLSLSDDIMGHNEDYTIRTNIVPLSKFGFNIDRVIGFKLVKGSLKYDTLDHTQAPHIDIIIPEIPYIACVKNQEGSHLIQRLSVYTAGAFYYENKKVFDNIYFTPIKLSTLTIECQNCTGGNLEFEVTTLNI